MVYQSRTFEGFLPDSASQRLLFLKGVSVLIEERLVMHKDGQAIWLEKIHVDGFFYMSG